MDLQRLREATAPDHASTEAAVPLMGENLTRADYIATLRGFHRVVQAWDAWAAAAAPADLRDMLGARRRAGLIADDLHAMGESAAPPTSAGLQARMRETAVAGDPRAVFLGRMYVMEGSTLGGQLLARHLEEHLGLTPGAGDSYLRGYGDNTGEMWKAFKAVLAALPDEATDTVIASAKNMFALFGEGMRESDTASTQIDSVNALPGAGPAAGASAADAVGARGI